MRKIIDDDVDLSNLHLTELFDLSDVEVTGNFNCHNNDLTSLEGAPKAVRGWFQCTSNNLTSLEGCPVTVGRGFNCASNNLTSLKGIPKTIGGNFYIGKSLRDKFPEEYIRSLCEIRYYVVYIFN